MQADNAQPMRESAQFALIPARLVWWGFGLLGFVLALRPVSPHDIWFTLLMGRKFLETHAVPQHEFFLYTADGAPDLFGAWGYGTLAHLAHRSFGLYGLMLMNASLWCASYMSAFMAIRLRTVGSLSLPFRRADVIAVGLAFLLVYEPVLLRTWMRPEATMFLAWSLGILLMEYGRQCGNFRLALIAYPIIVWIEAWLHTAGALLLLPILAYGAEQAWGLIAARPRQNWNSIVRHTLPWLLSLLGAVILPILNPNGILQIYAHVGMALQQIPIAKGFLSLIGFHNLDLLAEATNTRNIEYRPIWEWPPFQRIYLQLFVMTFLCFMVGEKRISSLITILPLSVFAILHIRGMGLFAWSLLVPFGITLTDLSRLIAGAHSKNSTIYSGGGFASAILLIVGFLFALNAKYDLQAKLPLKMPLAKGLETIRESHPQGGNIFTDIHLGALTAWSLGASYKVSTAAHLMTTHPELTRHVGIVENLREGWEDELRRYNVVAAVIRINNLPAEGMKPLALRLLFHPDWRLLSVEAEAAVFVRNPTNGATVSIPEKIIQIRDFWTVMCQLARDDREGADPRMLPALAACQRQLQIIQQTSPDPAMTLHKLVTEAEILPEWRGNPRADPHP